MDALALSLCQARVCLGLSTAPACVHLQLPPALILCLLTCCFCDVQKALDRFLIPDARQMVHELTEATGPGFHKLNDAVGLTCTFI